MAEQTRNSPKWQSQFVRFAGVGAVGTVAHYVLLVILVQVFSSNAVAASTAGAVLGALVNYTLNRRFTFRSDKRHGEALTKFLIIATTGLALNSFFMFVFVEIWQVHYLYAQLVSTGLVLVWNFTGNRLWTFNDAR